MKLDADTLKRLSPLLGAAIDLNPAERDAWLEGLQGDNALLAPVLRDLLTHKEIQTRVDALERGINLPGVAPDQIGQALGLQVDDTVGPYRLIRELGRGGMGSVWLAVRIDGTLKREIALKLPHVALSHHQLAERFARERDILAALTHPHIARLYDAGFTQDGRPFLALEFIDGEPLNTYCDARRLNVKARIKIFLQVLSAIQYAHSQLVVHRDLKPTNILVTADGEVKLLDFGIAKLLVDGQAHETELTQLGGRALSPQYASPEQILGQAIGTASDIYALGVVLFELLTGNLPYRLRRDSRGALEEAILDVEAQRPSRTQILVQIAQARSANSNKLLNTLKGDLDTILLKALKKSPTDRYATAQLFSDDLGRYLTGEPVHAQPDTRWYRADKFVRRNWMAVSAVAMVFVSLAVGMGVALWQAQAAKSSEALAKTEATRAQEVQKFLQEIITANSNNQVDPVKARQRTAREMLDIAASRIDGELKESPAAQLKLYETLASMYGELALYEQAYDLGSRQLKAARDGFGALASETLDAQIALARIEVDGGIHAADTLNLLEATVQALDARGEINSVRRGRLESILASYYVTRDEALSLQHAQRGAPMLETSAGSEDRESLLSTMVLLATGLSNKGDNAQAITIARRAVALAGPDGSPIMTDAQAQVYALAALGLAQFRMADYAGAEKSYRDSVTIVGKFQEAGKINSNNAGFMASLGLFLVRTSHYQEALTLLEPVYQESLKPGFDFNNETLLALQVHANAACHFGLIEVCDKALDRAFQIAKKVEATPDVLSELHKLKARLYIDAGRYADAAVELDRVVVLESQLNHQLATMRDYYELRIRYLLGIGRYADAEKELQYYHVDPPSREFLPLPVLTEKRLKCALELARGELDKSSAMAHDLEALVKGHPATYYQQELFQAARSLGDNALKSKNFSAAVAAYQRALGLGKIYDAASLAPAEIHLGLAHAYAGMGNQLEAQQHVLAVRRAILAHPKYSKHLASELNASI